MAGQVVYKTEGAGDVTIDTTKFPTGNYIVIVNNNDSQTYKVSIVH